MRSLATILVLLVLVALVAAAACGSDTTSPLPAVPLNPTATTALALGARFGCAITTATAAFCWGDDGSGQLGDSMRTASPKPTATTGQHQFVAVAAGDRTVCALDRGGIAWCWGEDPTKPGVAATTTAVPVRILAPDQFVSISVGRKFACGLTAGGTAYCWGENLRGQLGVGDTLQHSGTLAVGGKIRFSALSAGFWHVCGIDTQGSTYCWGDNQFAELATGETNTRFATAPQLISGNVKFRSISAGSVHTCALTDAGAAYCWGSNFGGHLGDGTSTFRLSPVPVATSLTFTLLRATRANDIFSHTCGVTTAGDVYCWGYNAFGQLGTASTKDECISSSGTATEFCSYTPVKVAGIANVKALDTGDGHTCALTTASQLYCWGFNAVGQLGDGGFSDHPVPALVSGSLKLP